MKPPAFEYLQPNSLIEAAGMLEEAGEGAQILAGGQSLLPTLSLRLSSPSLLIDINRVVDSTPLVHCDGVVRCGTRVRHVDLERSTMVKERVPLLALAMPHVAHPAIRNRGTPCGSIALADPAAEIPACALALNADIVLQNSGGRRTVPAEKYFIGEVPIDLGSPNSPGGAVISPSSGSPRPRNSRTTASAACAW